MEIVVKGRHTEVTERFRQHVQEKLAKIEKIDTKVFSIDVECSQERNPRLVDQRERIELTIRSRGPVIRAEAAAQDIYAALDAAYQKLESRLRRAHDRRKVHHGAKTPVSVATATKGLSATATKGLSATATKGLDATAGLDAQERTDGAERRVVTTTDDEVVEPTGPGAPLVLREKTHDAKPVSLDQALYEMELVGHDFYLFVDIDTNQPSVVYRRRGYDYGVIRLGP